MIELSLDNCNDSGISVNMNVIIDLEKLNNYNWDSYRLKIIHQNIRSISNLDDFTIFLDQFNSSFDVIILTECWINKYYTSKSIQNYSEYHTTFNLNKSSGIVIYIKDGIQAQVEEIPLSQSNCMKLVLNNNICIFAIYRSPSFINIDPFLFSLQSIINNSKKFERQIIIGDLNINTVPDYHRQSNDYLCLLAENGFTQTINSFTREQGSSKSCLDHINVKNINFIDTFVIHTTISDHYTTSICLKNKPPTSSKSKYVVRTNFNHLLEDLSSENWQNVLVQSDTDLAMKEFITKLHEYISKHTSNITVTNKQIKITPWITPGLVKSIHKRNNLHEKTKRYPENLILQAYYKKYRNLCKKLIKSSKENFYKKLIYENNCTPKRFWETFRNITKSKINKSSEIKSLYINTSNSEVPKDMANFANTYFTSVGDTLAKKILNNCRTTETDLANLTIPNLGHKIDKIETSSNEVMKIIDDLKSSKACGPDKISSNLLKIIKVYIALPIAFIANLSFKEGKFPHHLKHSIVILLHKNGDKSQIHNYRPVSLLNSVSKIIEKIVKNRISHYLENNNILSNRQYGFRNGLGTENAIANLTKIISSNLDKGIKCIALFLDLAKAFDTISHKILLHKLQRIGIQGQLFNWLVSYLKNRSQRVDINGTLSDPAYIKYGVPQGSTLGPLLFNIYINELCNSSFADYIITFADDTVLLFEDKTWNGCHSKAQIGINKVKQWLDNNLLTLNSDKTKFICFSPTQAGQPKEIHNIIIHHCNDITTCKCNTLECVDNIRYLGIIIDKFLRWDKHIDLTSTKVRKLTHLFIAIRNILSVKDLKRIYFAMCNSILDYASLGWGGCSKTILDPLAKSQKSLLRVILKKPFRYPSDSLFEEFRVLDVRQLYMRKIILHTQKQRHRYISVDHYHNTRHAKKNPIVPPTTSSSLAQRQFSYLGPKLLNLIPDTWKSEKDNILRRLVNDWLLALGRVECENMLNNSN